MDIGGRLQRKSVRLKLCNPEVQNPRHQATQENNFIQWWPLFVGPPYGIWFMLPIWNIEFWGGF